MNQLFGLQHRGGSSTFAPSRDVQLFKHEYLFLIQPIGIMMKKIAFVLIALLTLYCVSINAQSINNPIKGDINEDGVVNTADVVALVNIIINGEKTEQGEIILSNSELSSRLKDKYGNPVLLTSTNTSVAYR